jgi:hydrogenase maturation protease
MPLLVGVGNPWRRDDGVGPAVARRVASMGIPDVEVVVEAEPLSLLEHLRRPDTVVVVDAGAPGPRPGRVSVLRVGHREGPAWQASALDPHSLGVAEVVELARVLGPLPDRLVVVVVESGEVTVGVGLSTPVAERLDLAVAAVVDALGSATHPPRHADREQPGR